MSTSPPIGSRSANEGSRKVKITTTSTGTIPPWPKGVRSVSIFTVPRRIKVAVWGILAAYTLAAGAAGYALHYIV